MTFTGACEVGSRAQSACSGSIRKGPEQVSFAWTPGEREPETHEVNRDTGFPGAWSSNPDRFCPEGAESQGLLRSAP